MITFPNSKINIGLNIVEKRVDGYHNLETVFYPIPLQDALEIVPAPAQENGFRFTASGVDIEGDPDTNLVVKAYKLLSAAYQLPPIDIYLHKNIPTGAGLGGGSSDAAFMLKLLNEAFSLNLQTEELEIYAGKLGADCPFFIRNTPVYAEGTGNLFSPVSLSLKGYKLILVKPRVFVSTKDAFSRIIPIKPPVSVKEIVATPITEWKELLKNDFETSVFALYPEIAQIKEELYAREAIYASMSGSGASVYGLFNAEQQVNTNVFGNCFVYETLLD
ncbi:4-(cytidine 5'-diphospho)-2-C-methyl-D-erythritol kinase [Bacteroides sp.]|uniref:4-(cytidine 5'-diphospho)-2-C-methyl-D-erythritol kinase n=1 Tax=Bacteroides sp. TaxID=29523 RepID=UPI003D0CA155